jgi:hypothetical protein
MNNVFEVVDSEGNAEVVFAKAHNRTADALYAAFDRAMSEAFPGTMRWDHRQLLPDVRGMSWDTGSALFAVGELSVREGKYGMSGTDDIPKAIEFIVWARSQA